MNPLNNPAAYACGLAITQARLSHEWFSADDRAHGPGCYILHNMSNLTIVMQRMHRMAEAFQVAADQNRLSHSVRTIGNELTKLCVDVWSEWLREDVWADFDIRVDDSALRANIDALENLLARELVREEQAIRCFQLGLAIADVMVDNPIDESTPGFDGFWYWRNSGRVESLLQALNIPCELLVSELDESERRLLDDSQDYRPPVWLRLDAAVRHWNANQSGHPSLESGRSELQQVAEPPEPGVLELSYLGLSYDHTSRMVTRAGCTPVPISGLSLRVLEVLNHAGHEGISPEALRNKWPTESGKAAQKTVEKEISLLRGIMEPLRITVSCARGRCNYCLIEC